MFLVVYDVGSMLATLMDSAKMSQLIMTQIRHESAPIQLAQCRFPGLAICNAKILIHISSKIYESNFIKQHSETVMIRNYQNAACSLRKKMYCHC